MDLTRGVCYLCSNYTGKILQTSDTEEFYKQLYNLLGAENLNESEFQKCQQFIKLCPLCCFSIASASQWKNELTVDENPKNEMQNCCFLCRCNKFLLKVDSNWKYLKECLHCLSYDSIQGSCLGEENICMSCFQKIDFAYKTKNKLVAKYPKLKVLQSPPTKAQKKSRTPDLLPERTPEIVAPESKVDSDVKDVVETLEPITNKRRKISHKIEKNQLQEGKSPSSPNLNRMLCHLKCLDSDISYQNIKDKYKDQLLMKNIPYVLINGESKTARHSSKNRLSNKVKKRVSFKLDVIDIIPDDVPLGESNQYHLSNSNSNTHNSSDSATNRVANEIQDLCFVKPAEENSAEQVLKRKKRQSPENETPVSSGSSPCTDKDLTALNDSPNNTKEAARKSGRETLKTKRKILIDGNSSENKKLKCSTESSSKSKKSFQSTESSTTSTSKSTAPLAESEKPNAESSNMTITKINSERSPFAFKIKFKKETKHKYKPGPKSRKTTDFSKEIEGFGFTNSVVINLENMDVKKYLKMKEVESPINDLEDERIDNVSAIDDRSQSRRDGDHRLSNSIDIKNKKHKREINEIAKKYLEPTQDDIFSDTESAVENNSSIVGLTNDQEGCPVNKEPIDSEPEKLNSQEDSFGEKDVPGTRENQESVATSITNDKNFPDKSTGTQKSDENLNEKLTSDNCQISLNATQEVLSKSSNEIKLCSDKLDDKNGSCEQNIDVANQDYDVISDRVEDHNKVDSSSSGPEVGAEVDNSNDCDNSQRLESADDMEPAIENKSSNSDTIDICDSVSDVDMSKYNSNGNSDLIDEFKVPKGKSLLEEISDFESDDTLTLQETIDLVGSSEGCQSVSDDSPISSEGALIIGKNKFITSSNSEKEDLDLHPNSELVLKCDVNTKTPSVSPTAELINDPGDEFFNSLLGLESLDVDRIDENQPIVDKNLTPCQTIDESKPCDLKDKKNIKTGKKRVKSAMRTIQTPTN